KRAKRLHELVQPAVVIEMVFLDVETGSHSRPEIQKRPVVFAGLNNEMFAVTDPRPAAELLDARSDHKRRIQPRLAQDVRDHRRRGALAMRAGDSDALAP